MCSSDLVGFVDDFQVVDSNDGTNDTNNLEAGMTDVAVATFQVSNNSTDGFSVSIASLNAGKYIDTISGLERAYTMTATQTGGTNGAAGGTADPVASPASIDVVNGDTLTWGDIQQGTSDMIVTLKVSSPSDTSLLEGTYTDTLQITYSDT